MMRIALRTLLLIAAFAQPSIAQETAVPKGLLKDLRAAAETCDMAAMVKMIVPYLRPDTDEETLRKAAQECQQGSGKELAIALTLAADMQPEYHTNGLVAIYNLSGFDLPFKKRGLRFVKYDGTWYFMSR
jgi:hypothetical protein